MPAAPGNRGTQHGSLTMQTDREWRENAGTGTVAMIQRHRPSGTEYIRVTVIRGTATQLTTSDGNRWIRRTGHLVGARTYSRILVAETPERLLVKKHCETIDEARLQITRAINELDTVRREACKADVVQAARLALIVEAFRIELAEEMEAAQ